VLDRIDSVLLAASELEMVLWGWLAAIVLGMFDCELLAASVPGMVGCIPWKPVHQLPVLSATSVLGKASCNLAKWPDMTVCAV